MKKLALFMMLLVGLTATAQTTFNYNEWKARQEGRDSTTMKPYQGDHFAGTRIYGEAFMQFGNMRGPGATLGLSYDNYALELSFLKCLDESYQVQRKIGQETHAYTYNSFAYGARIGYGIKILDYLRVTPLVGLGITNVNGTQANENSVRSKESTNLTQGTVAAQIHFAFTKNFYLSLTPQYTTLIKSDALYELIRQDYYIQRWAEGFSFKAGLCLSF